MTYLEALRRVCARLIAVEGQMAHDICEQIKDRTVAAVCKAWPEVAPFVYKEMRIDPLKSGGPTPVPFSAMVSRNSFRQLPRTTRPARGINQGER